MKNYYGFRYCHGSRIYVEGAAHGDAGTLAVFDCKEARDKWVEEGTAGLDEPGARTAYPASKVRKHVVTGAYGDRDRSTRSLVNDLAGSCVEDYRHEK